MIGGHLWCVGVLLFRKAQPKQHDPPEALPAHWCFSRIYGSYAAETAHSEVAGGRQLGVNLVCTRQGGGVHEEYLI